MLWEIVKIVQVGVRNHCQYAKSGHLVLALSCCLLRQARRELARNANVRRGHGEFGAFAQILVEMLSEIRPTRAVWNGLIATRCLAIQRQAVVDVALHELRQLLKRGARACRRAEQAARSGTHFHPWQPL